MRGSVQERNWRKISPRLRTARVSPLGNRPDRLRDRGAERVRQRQRAVLDAQSPHEFEQAGTVAAQARQPRVP